MIGAGAFKKFDKVIFLLGDSDAPQKIFSAQLKSKERWVIETILGDSKKLRAWSRFSPHFDFTHTNLVLSQTLKDAALVMPGQSVNDINKIFSTPAKLLEGHLEKPVSLIKGDVKNIYLQVPESSLALSGNDEIIVKATSKKRKAKEPPQIHLGRDYLKGCTALEFSPQDKRVNLYCDDEN